MARLIVAALLAAAAGWLAGQMWATSPTAAVVFSAFVALELARFWGF